MKKTDFDAQTEVDLVEEEMMAFALKTLVGGGAIIIFLMGVAYFVEKCFLNPFTCF